MLIVSRPKVTMISAAIICTFTLIEFIDYRRVYTDTSVIVDRSRGEKLSVTMNMSFPHVPCYRELSRAGYFLHSANVKPLIVLSMDIMDISGEQHQGLDHSMVKTRLTSDFQRIDDGKLNQGTGKLRHPNSSLTTYIELKNELDKVAAARGEGYCGSCYGGVPPESGCCQTCDQVRTAYFDRGWSFSNPDNIEQVRIPVIPSR